ncbi:MAG: WYL domain-containing protein [Schleiferiaceae bacterium]|nr:WYL domain-containing protein [Schleiferiaceae bacterium]
MAQRETIHRHHLIITKLRKHPCTFEELADYLGLESQLQEYDFTISQRTFQRDIRLIASVYNIEIVYDRSLGKYSISMDENDSAKELVFEAFDTFNALNLTTRIAQHIHFQKRKPAGTLHLHGLLHSINQQVLVRFHHTKNYGSNEEQRHVAPLGLKEYRSRWYLVARDEKDQKIKTFGLDRVKDLEITTAKFTPPQDFSLDTYFQYSWGIIVGGQNQPEKVELQFTPFQGQYIKSLPLHPSQIILVDNDQELRVQLHVHATHDFMMEILSMTPEINVLKPKFLRDEIRRKLERGMQLYQ